MIAKRTLLLSLVVKVVKSNFAKWSPSLVTFMMYTTNLDHCHTVLQSRITLPILSSLAAVSLFVH